MSNYEVYLNAGYSDVRIEIEDEDCNLIAGFDKTQFAELKSQVSELRAAGHTVTLHENLAAGCGKVEIAELATC